MKLLEIKRASVVGQLTVASLALTILAIVACAWAVVWGVSVTMSALRGCVRAVISILIRKPKAKPIASN